MYYQIIFKNKMFNFYIIYDNNLLLKMLKVVFKQIFP